MNSVIILNHGFCTYTFTEEEEEEEEQLNQGFQSSVFKADMKAFMDFEVTVDFDNLFHCSIILMEKVCNLCVVLHCFLKILSE